MSLAPVVPFQLPPRFVDPPQDYPVQVTSIQYGLLSAEDVHRLSVLPCRRVIGHVRDFGLNDDRLGVCDRVAICATCGQRSLDCVGHVGHVDLEAPVFHLGFFTTVLRMCRTICKSCARVLLTKEEVTYYTRRLQAHLEPQQYQATVKQIQEDAYKTRICTHCGSVNGVVRRVRPMRLVHEKYRVELRRGEESTDDPQQSLYRQLHSATMHNKEIADHIDHIQEFLDPVRVRQLFLSIPPEEYAVLGLQAGAKPVDLLLTTLAVPPVCARPRGLSGLNQVREDDLTTQYNDILISSDVLKDGSNDTCKYVENWDLLQQRVARLLDSAMPGFPSHLRTADCKSFAQRMKGKHGRFRGNLSGKRVDFSGRSVISPDPNLAIDELAVPLRVARVLTYPQRVYAHNIDLMRRLVRNGPLVHPGAITVYLAKESSRKSLHNARDRELLAARISIGDVIERHVMNGDMILFNRQPSLHRISMMAHRARVLPFRTFRFNECCCSPYNADFDGDEMNVHVVQTEEARAEAKELMLTSNNIITAKNGEPIIACTQDFLTAAYLVTSRDTFFDRAQFTFMVSHWLGQHTTYQLPIPALLMPAELWTGKQLMELILQPSPETNVLLNLEAKARFYSGKGKQDDPAEGFVSFLDSHLISGRLDKKLLGGGAKDGLFARLYALTGGMYTGTCMSRIAQFTSRYLQNYGFSLGLGDVSPTPSLNALKSEVLARSFSRCEELISEASTGRLVPLPGMTVRQSLEAKLNGELSTVRDECGSAAVQTLDPTVNAPLIMVNSGSKGSALNTAQMMACVGQQTVSGKRIVNAFQDRSLPHFWRHAEAPAARGFVANSFYSGLTPTEFFFHTMAGREGLVDTAVKTAETGYIYRRLSKAMENLSVKYDQTVRNALGAIVQLRYGEDGLDPWLMEGSNGTPLNLDQEWLAARAAYARHVKSREARRAQLSQAEEQGTAQWTTLLAAAKASLMDEDQCQEWYIRSMLPGNVLPYVWQCLSGDEAVLAACERREAAERTEEEAFTALSRALQGQPAPTKTSASKPLRINSLRRLATTGSERFREDVGKFFERLVQQQSKLRTHLGLPLDAYGQPSEDELSANRRIASPVKGSAKRKGTKSTPSKSAAGGNTTVSAMEALQSELLPLTEGIVGFFLEECGRKYLRKSCEPGTPCGAIAAQSVGEPSTQMTLRTFHFAGVASMSITQGVPRLVEVINANRNIATPVVTAPIVVKEDHIQSSVLGIDPLLATMSPSQQQALTSRAVTGLMERVTLKEVATEMVEVVSSNRFYIQVYLNMPLIRKLMLPINAVAVRQRILQAAAKPMSALRHLREDCVEVVSLDSLLVYPYESDPRTAHFNVQYLLTVLPDIVVGGIAGVNRVMVANGGAELLAEGAELRAVMTLPHVDGTRTKCNHVAVVEKTLGIEAARQVIVNEISGILKAYSLSIDVRHVYLLADVMTSRGVVLGITRYGIQKMNNNVLTMASFERTTEHLYNAAVMQRADTKLSVSESIIIGKPVPLGTSAFSVLLAKGMHDDEPTINRTKMMAPGKDAFLSRAYQRYASGGRDGPLAGAKGCGRRPMASDGTFCLNLFA